MALLGTRTTDTGPGTVQGDRLIHPSSWLPPGVDDVVFVGESVAQILATSSGVLEQLGAEDVRVGIVGLFEPDHVDAQQRAALVRCGAHEADVRRLCLPRTFDPQMLHVYLTALTCSYDAVVGPDERACAPGGLLAHPVVRQLFDWIVCPGAEPRPAVIDLRER